MPESLPDCNVDGTSEMKIAFMVTPLCDMTLGELFTFRESQQQREQDHRATRLTEKETIHVSLQLCSALLHLYQHNIVHR
jgi:serine/threonine protein kinase